MKKLLCFCFILTAVVDMHGQKAQPTKEETITFMEKVLKGGVGMSFEWETIIQDVTFEGDNMVIFSSSDENRTYYISNLPWEYLDKSNFKSGNSYCNFGIYFTKNYKRRDKYADYPEATEFLNELNLSIPHDKIESFKKACIRLSEIYAEENKDPFAD